MRYLWLSHKDGDRTKIVTPSGDVIWIRIHTEGAASVKVGFNAPRTVSILREKVVQRNERDGPA